MKEINSECRLLRLESGAVRKTKIWLLTAAMLTVLLNAVSFIYKGDSPDVMQFFWRSWFLAWFTYFSLSRRVKSTFGDVE